MNISLETPLQNFPRIGKKTSATLARLGLNTARDILYWFPQRYEDFRNILPISTVTGGSYACIKAKVRLVTVRRSFRKGLSLAEALLEDRSGSIKAIWFHQPYLATSLAQGDELFVAGRVDEGKYGIQFVNPVFERVSSSPTHTARVVPVYPLTRELTQKTVRALVKAILPLAKNIPDPIPEQIRKEEKLMPLPDALRIIHFPITVAHASQARERIGFQEMIDVFTRLARIASKRKKEKATAVPIQSARMQASIAQLPFTLTPAQKRVLEELQNDLSNPIPMNRLINGDVGSGKTVLVHLIAQELGLAGLQTAFLVPTDILAQQHAQSCMRLFPGQNLSIAVFTRTKRTIYANNREQDVTKKTMLESLKKGEIAYVIGTHTLIQESVLFRSLGLVVVDEQHRFGVSQRATLPLATKSHSGKLPHFLSLTATPIPRSLARIVFGGGDISLLEAKPKDRKAITTRILTEPEREQAYKHIRQEAKRGRQAFVICPIIEESDRLGVKAATQEYEALRADIFPDLGVGILHGKQSATVRDAVMRDFLSNKIQILVATAVVEVGVDVPNATTMLIEGAERFGLAQLHQFRGRIGRGSDESTCYAIQSNDSDKARERLTAFAVHASGFRLSEIDLGLRGPGALFGTVQSGFLPLRVADIANTAFVERSQRLAKKILVSRLKT